MAKKRADGYLKKTFKIDGKRYYVYGHNEKELFEKEKLKRGEIEQGYSKRENPTLNDFFERWIAGRRESIKGTTIRGQEQEYKKMAEIYIPSSERTFGEMQIKKITIDDLRIVQSELKKERKSQTVNDYMALIKHIMKDAANERIIDYNPCVLLKPLRRTEEKARDTSHRALTQEEQTLFFSCERTKNSFYYNAFRIAILTGMRAGEIGALRESDLRDGLIHVERTVTRTEYGFYTIGESAKTAAGKRTIPINAAIKEVLSNQREINRLLDGNVISLDDTIFKAAERGIFLSTPADREIRRICKEIGIEPFSMHAFRATFATRAIENGMNPRTLQELLGHSNFNITMSLYGHVLNDTKTKEMEKLIIAI